MRHEQKITSKSRPETQQPSSPANEHSDDSEPSKSADRRPQAIAQRKLQTTMNQSPQVQRLAQLQDKIDNSHRQRAQADPGPIQRQISADEELQTGKDQPLQAKSAESATTHSRRREARMGIPAPLKAGIETLSGVSMGEVSVHYNSSKPAQLQALAFTQGTEIHVGPGEERHLPHEAWHAVQQRQGRVKPTLHAHGASVNDDAALENEADVMGAKALQTGHSAKGAPEPAPQMHRAAAAPPVTGSGPIQRLLKRPGELQHSSIGHRSSDVVFAGRSTQGPLDRYAPPSQNSTAAPNKLGGDVIQGRFVDEDNFKGLLDEQWQAQNQLQHDDETPYVTVGFEHEFAQMVDGPLMGTTHAELAGSVNRKMPITGLGFKLETDAADAVELVSPPFIFEPISDTIPVPKPADVAKADHIIQERLSKLTSDPQTFSKLLTGLNSDPGIEFQPQNVSLSSSNVNPQIDTKSWEINKEDNTAEVGQKDVLGMTVKGARKLSLRGGISTQVNFATGARTYAGTQETVEADHRVASEKPDEDTKLFLVLEKDIRASLDRSMSKITWKQPSDAIPIFLDELARRLASTLAVPSIRKVEEAKVKVLRDDRRDKDSFRLHAALRSHVKDTKALWAKDTIENFGLGILEPKDWLLVHAIAISESLKNDIRNLSVLSKKGNRTEINDNLIYAKLEMLTGLGWLALRIREGQWGDPGREAETKKRMSSFEAQPAFGSHTPERLGARQDTFLSLAKGTAALRWPDQNRSRLHVVETRGNPLKTLLLAQIGAELKAKAKTDEIVENVKTTVDAIFHDAKSRLDNAKAAFGKSDPQRKRPKPHFVKVLEDAVAEAENLKKYAHPERINDIANELG